MRLTGAGASGAPRAQRVLDAVPPASGAVVMGPGILCVDLYAVGQPVVAAVLLGLAVVSWALLLTPVLSHWETPVAGVSFLLTVATQGLAVLGATLAARNGAAWLLIVAVAALILGLAFYIVIVTHFALRQLLTSHGDQWVAGGALAISALACVKITKADDALGRLTWMHGFLGVAALVLWCLAMLWLGPLIAAEALRPRLSYDVQRWATVFPLGMYAACSFAISQATGVTGIGVFARVWTWLAVTVSLLVLAGLIRRSWQVLPG